MICQADNLGLDLQHLGILRRRESRFHGPFETRSAREQPSLAFGGNCSMVSPNGLHSHDPNGTKRTRNRTRDCRVILTNLFDRSYLHPSGCESEILASPARATDERALPPDIWIYTCEYDDLCNEGGRFSERLNKLGRTSTYHDSSESIPAGTLGHSVTEEGDGFTKRVRYNMIPGVPHAWDKAPNPLWVNEIARARYLHAVQGLKQVWATKGS